MNIPPVGGPSIPIVFDFNKAPANALQVASETNALGVRGVFTTNASQWEPGEFVNGVVSFGPNENVFILHNVGTAQGSNQRFVALQLNSPVALLLQGMRFRSHTNAFGCSPENPVVLAVEAATRDDFADATVLGTIPTFGGPLAEKSLPLGVRVPAGPINIRLRSTSPVPDGSNYIAYIDFALAVSPLQSSPPPVIQPHADVGPIEATSADGAIVTYDPALAKDVSGAAAAITYSQESGTLFPIGLTTVTVTATDAANNTATSRFTVTVVATPHLVVEQPPGTPLVSGSAIVAWGDNRSGQASVPDGLKDVRAIAAGQFHTVALKKDGTIVAWGDNSYGQTSVPDGLTGVQAVAAGLGYTVALKSDGTVLAWGENSLGQTSVPNGLTDVQAIAAGVCHTVALKSDSTVVTWGSLTSKPERVTDVQAVAAGFFHTVELKSDGTVLAWGDNRLGQTNVPDGLTKVRAIAAGAGHTVALKSDGTVLAWGDNRYGQTSVPQGLTDVRTIAAGAYHTVALKGDGTVLAWGENGCGQASVPGGLRGVRAIAAGGSHTVALVRGSVDFARQKMGESSAAKTFLLKNTGLAELNIIGASITGENAGDFRVDMKGMAEMLEPGAQTAFSVAFTPSAAGNRDAGLRLVTNDATPILKIALTGEGVDITPPIIQAHADVGPIVATSAGGAIVTYEPAVAKNDSGTEPIITYSQESGTLFPIGTTIVMVTATDAANNMARTQFKVTVVAAPRLVIEQPAGTPLLEMSNVIFDGQEPGISTAAKTFTLKNAGSAPLEIGGIMVTGDNAGDFTIDTRAMAGSLAPGGETTFSITFTPSAIGNRTALLRVVTNDAITPSYDVALSGTGFDAPPMIAPHEDVGPIEATSAAGAIVTYEPAMVTGVVQTITYSQESGTTFPIGVTTVTITGTDAANRTATATFTVTVTGRPHLAIEQPPGTPLLGGTRLAAWGSHSQNQTKAPEGLTGVEAIAAGGYHTVALKKDGTVSAWGAKGQGRTDVPIGLTRVQVIAAGQFHTLALMSDGIVVAWGDNSQGQTIVPDGVRAVRGVAAGGYHSVALKNNGAVAAWGDNSCGQTDVPIGLTDVRAIAAGQFHTVALKTEGTFVSWGDTRFGQGTLPHGMRAVVAIAAGALHSVALQDDGTVVAWGSNEFRQTDVPNGLRDVQAIAAGKNFTVALKSDGTVIAWGENSYGQTNVPADLSNVQAIAAGIDHVVALVRVLPSTDFGRKIPGRSVAKTFALNNTGTTPLTIISATVIGKNPGDFSVGAPDVTSVRAGSQATLVITFTPGFAVGDRAAILRVMTDDPVNPNYDVQLTGTGFTPQAIA